MKIKELREILDNISNDEDESLDIALDIPNTEGYITELERVYLDPFYLVFKFDVRYNIHIDVY